VCLSQRLVDVVCRPCLPASFRKSPTFSAAAVNMAARSKRSTARGMGRYSIGDVDRPEKHARPSVTRLVSTRAEEVALKKLGFLGFKKKTKKTQKLGFRFFLFLEIVIISSITY